MNLFQLEEDSQSNTLSDSIATLKLAEEAIENDDVELLMGLLSLMPIEQLNVEEADDFFSNFMDLCTAFNRGECMKAVFDSWNRVYPPNEKTPLYAKLFLIPRVDVNSLSFISKVYGHYTYLEVMDDLVAHDSNRYMLEACERTIQVFGEQPYDTYKVVFQLAENVNSEVANFISGKIREIAPFADIPKWVRDFRPGEHDTLPLASEVVVPEKINFGFDLPPMEEIIDMLSQGFESSGMTIEDKADAQDILRARISIATISEKKELLRPVIDMDRLIEDESDEELFRILGPSNPLVNSSLDEMIYGGCRMFTCSVFDHDEDTGYVEDWFEGFCHKCDLRIRNRWHAVRMPRPHGGWRGCFCSWRCVREAVYTDGVNPEGKADMLTDLLIDAFEVQINIIGIQDRIPDIKISPDIQEYKFTYVSLDSRSIIPPFLDSSSGTVSQIRPPQLQQL